MLRPNCWPFILAFAEGLHAILFFNMFFQFYRRVYLNQGANAAAANAANNNVIKNGSAAQVKDKAN